MDPVFLAISKLRRRKFDECIDITTKLLEKNPVDQVTTFHETCFHTKQQVWYLKCKALTEKTWIDDTELEEEGVAEVLLDDNAIAQLPRPGTSLARPLSSAKGVNPGVRPLSASGRPLSGFSRPGTNRPTTSSMESALQGAKPGTSRPVTSSGRSSVSTLKKPGGQFVNAEKLNLKKYGARPALAKLLFEYLLYHDNNARKAFELAAVATEYAEFKDWWWKSAVGKCYYKLGLYREAEKHLLSSLKEMDMINTVLWLAKVYIRLDSPNKALEQYIKAAEKFSGEVSLILGVARIHDGLNDFSKSLQYYKLALSYDPSNIEAIASLASAQFYNDQPELALRYYRRLLQMGVNSPEIWNNLGLCCFYAQQYDMTLTCFERALTLADDDTVADIWYNISHVAIGIGDLVLAQQALKICTSNDPRHAEALNNLGVLELRKEILEPARGYFISASDIAKHLYNPVYNEALVLYKMGEFQLSYKRLLLAIKLYPDHEDSKELMKTLKVQFTSL